MYSFLIRQISASYHLNHNFKLLHDRLLFLCVEIVSKVGDKESYTTGASQSFNAETICAVPYNRSLAVSRYLLPTCQVLHAAVYLMSWSLEELVEAITTLTLGCISVGADLRNKHE